MVPNFSKSNKPNVIFDCSIKACYAVGWNICKSDCFIRVYTTYAIYVYSDSDSQLLKTLVYSYRTVQNSENSTSMYIYNFTSG